MMGYTGTMDNSQFDNLTRFGIFAAVVESDGDKAIIQVGDSEEIDYTVDTLNSFGGSDVRCFKIDVTGVSGDLTSASTDEINKIMRNKAM